MRTLADSLSEMALSLSNAQIQQIESWLDELEKWNRVWNLTAIRNRQQALVHHVLDSLAMLKHLPEDASVADIGTGAGIPGTLLAIARPQQKFFLIDSNDKKMRFVTHCKILFGLDNLVPLTSRVEQVDLKGEKIDIITSRAFTSLSRFVEITRPLAYEGTQWLAMKGKNARFAVDDPLPAGYLSEVQHLRVPGLDAERTLVRINQGES